MLLVEGLPTDKNCVRKVTRAKCYENIPSVAEICQALWEN